MSSVQGMYAELLQSLTQEIHQLRERQSQWREEREGFVQKERWWNQQWQERERFYQTLELQWSQGWFEREQAWNICKTGLEMELQEYKEREELLLAQLRRSEANSSNTSEANS